MAFKKDSPISCDSPDKGSRTPIFKILSHVSYATDPIDLSKIFLSNINRVKFVRMTGSGSVIVAYFSNKKSAINGLKLIKRKFKNNWSIVSKTI